MALLGLFVTTPFGRVCPVAARRSSHDCVSVERLFAHYLLPSACMRFTAAWPRAHPGAALLAHIPWESTFTARAKCL